MSDIIKTYAQVVADTVAQIAGETEAVDKAAQLRRRDKKEMNWYT